MWGVVGHKISGAIKLPCNSLTFVLTFFQMQKDKIQGRAPHPGCGDCPEHEVKAESSSQGRVGKVVHLPSLLAEHAYARCCRCPRHAKEQRRAGIFRAPFGVKSRFEVP
ncbi:uncharacterized protein LOC118696813 isoform X4 [Molothrus ater]|uniref:uncharacterized protein LOC118696813 isoform X4 n=1 Tax=Molothrus ater TaxID=84834 RepID=UPI0023E76A62|nr:uncharacterized protein LOC118696813 isoform X4 [Molothrus ater]